VKNTCTRYQHSINSAQEGSSQQSVYDRSLPNYRLHKYPVSAIRSFQSLGDLIIINNNNNLIILTMSQTTINRYIEQ